MKLCYVNFKTIDDCNNWLDTIATGSCNICKSQVRNKLGLQQIFNNDSHIQTFCNKYNASATEISEF